MARAFLERTHGQLRSMRWCGSQPWRHSFSTDQ
jgi:hypothetical protein